MAYNTSPHYPRPTGPDMKHSFELKNFITGFTNESWALGNHHQLIAHMHSFSAILLLCALFRQHGILVWQPSE